MLQNNGRLTSADYREEIKTSAEQVLDRVENEDRPVSDAVFEEVDSSRYIMYFDYNTDVLDHSAEGPGGCKSTEGGRTPVDSSPKGNCKEWRHFVSDDDSWKEVVQAMAFSAMRNDIYTKVDELQEDT